MASDSGTKNNAKAEYGSWLVAKGFPGWFPGSLFGLRVKRSTNSHQLSLLFGRGQSAARYFPLLKYEHGVVLGFLLEQK